ncbi:MAG: PD40 domain-containing protein [Verrucomicrobia bacterium]|nr:PD40 domain-containing protein [Verrucomicrobiota bacterium]
MRCKQWSTRWGLGLGVAMGLWATADSGLTADAAEDELEREVADQGWIVYAARTAQGDYDLFLSRPNGSGRRNLTQTPGWSEYGGRFSPDGTRLLYRRQVKGPEVRPGEGINHDLWGATGSLCVALVDGTGVEALGGDGELPWASWSPDGRQLACLYRREGRIRIVELATRRVVRELPRQGIFQQMYWSSDGRRLCGTANLSGQDWNVVSLELETGKVTLLSRVLNCTADWFQADAGRVIYSHRTPGLADAYGWTMLMQATADGASRTLIYAERGRHVYYGCMSPDDRYVIFAVPETDGGTDAPMAIVRVADTPIVVPEDYTQVRSLYPGARAGPVFRLAQPGFEPHWTSAEIGGVQ